jgi:hypothetical protein
MLVMVGSATKQATLEGNTLASQILVATCSSCTLLAAKKAAATQAKLEGNTL